jgi:iron-sulfur cluster assembly protein
MERSGITLTEDAAREASQIIEEQGGGFLRLWVAGGGCSGLNYGLGIDTAKADDDQEFESNGVKVVVDELSLKYVDGSTIEYNSEVLGGGFMVNNPNATGGCGCGNSFKTDEGGCGSGECGCG